jgi:transposase
MAISDASGLPIAANVECASPHEVTLVKNTLNRLFINKNPIRLIADKAYDCDPLDDELKLEYNCDLIAPHKGNRRKSKTQDGRSLRRYKRRWKIERLFAWLQNFRRIGTRYEYHAANFLGMVLLGCSIILLRQF